VETPGKEWCGNAFLSPQTGYRRRRQTVNERNNVVAVVRNHPEPEVLLL
jgi:hypothetical protein